MNHFLEIRSYALQPGTRDEFQRFLMEEALPRSNAGMWMMSLYRSCKKNSLMITNIKDTIAVDC